MVPCSIKDSAEAWNDGIDAFKKAFKQTGGNTTESINYALEEINKKYPDFNFDPKSFHEPIIKSLKKSGKIPSSYSYGPPSAKGFDKKLQSIADKMESLSPDQKKSFARDIFKEISEKGSITDQRVKDIYSSAVGIPSMTPKVEAKIEDVAKAVQEADKVESDIKDKLKEMQAAKTANGGKLSEADDKKFQKEFADLSDRKKAAKDKAMEETAKLGEFLDEKMFWLHQLGIYMPLNLMSPNSLIKNASGAVADTFIRTIGNTMASPISKAVSMFTKIDSNPIGARLKGATTEASIKEKARQAWKYGKTDFDKEIPQSNFLKSSKSFAKAADEVGLNKLSSIVGGILKIHPEYISKGLSVPDAIVYEMTMAAEMERIAQAKGLKGADKEAFLLEPDEKSVEVAEKLAKQVTFKQDLQGALKGINKFFAYDAHEGAKKWMAEGTTLSPTAVKLLTGMKQMVLKTAAPFVKTPINILRTSSKILLPEYELAQAINQARKETDPIEKQRLYVDGFSKAAAGFFVRYVAIQMVTKGLISAGYDDEDKKVKDIVEQKLGGPNRINLSALMRGLTMRDMTAKKDDINVDLNSLGAIGLVMGAYANAWNAKDRKSIENETYYSKNLLNAISVPKDLAFSQLKSMVDFTFMTGINNIQTAFTGGQYERNKLGIDLVANIFTGIVPATVQKLSTQASPNVKKQYDSDLSFTSNLQNALGYRFAFQNKDLKDKYFSLSQEGKALKKKEHLFFDNYLGRVLESEFDFLKLTKDKGNDNPVSRLYEESRMVPTEERAKLFPNAIGEIQSIKTKTNRTKGSYKINTTEEQNNYLQEHASNLRMLMATPFIMSEDFKKFDYETKTKVLQSIYTQALEYAKQDMKKQFPDIKNQKIEGSEQIQKRAKRASKKYSKRPQD